MLWAVLVPLAVWWVLRQKRARTRFPAVALVALLAVPASGGLGAIWPAVELWTDSQVRTLIFPPACYPFTIISVHDFDARLFSYRIVLGWPDGVPVVVLPTEDDQSEFMTIQHLTCAVILTQLAFLAGLAALAGILAVETGVMLWIRSRSPKPVPDVPI